ncbi:RNA polymerase sigma factor [Dactylosporangium cerinum]
MADRRTTSPAETPLAGFEQFYESSFQRVVGRVFLIVGDAHLAEELAQDAMVELMAQWAGRRDRPAESNTAWTVGIAANLARRHWRRLVVHTRVLTRLAGRRQAGASSIDEQTIVHVDTYRSLAALPRRQREIATLWVLCDMTAEEIADALDISASAVRTQMQRIRKRLATDGTGNLRPRRG